MRLEVTRKSNLAVLALRALDGAVDRVKGPEVAERVGTTVGFVSQVLAPLVRAGWVRSDPGPAGGYVLAIDLRAVSVLAVIEAVEGPTDSGRCVLVDRLCDTDGVCAVHSAWVSARAELLRELDAISIADAALCDLPEMAETAESVDSAVSIDPLR